MAVVPLLNAYLYVGGHDFTGDSNAVMLDASGTSLDATTFRSSGWTEHVMGLRQPKLSAKGHWQSAAADAVDPDIWAAFNTGGNVVTVGDAETEDLPAIMFQAFSSSYHPFRGSLGELAGYDLDCEGSDGIGFVRGGLALKKTTVTTTGAKGTGLNLGLVGAGQYLYSTLHLLGTAGTSITAVVESDDANTFLSATTRITFGPLTASGATWGTRVAGAIASDTWFRLRVTAITGTWAVACAIGIR